jgi:hypothetical protein
MRLFRQTRVGDWTDVIAKLRDALEQWSRLRPDQRAAATVARKKPAERILSVPLEPRAQSGAKLSFAVRTSVGTMQCLPENDIVSESLRYYGEYLQPQLDLLRRLIPPGATVMEIGSGIGAHALFLSNAIGASGHLLLDEPRAKLEGMLRQNLAANSVTNMTVLVQSSSASRRAVAEPVGAAEPVPAGTTPQAVDELQLERLNCLKVNECVDPIEVLKSAVDTFWKLRPIVFAAAVDDEGVDEMAALMRSCSYRTWRHTTPLFNPGNFNLRTANIFEGKVAHALFAVPEEVEMDVAIDRCIELR